MTKTPKEYFNKWPAYFGPKIGACDVLVTYKNGLNPTFYENNGCHGIMGNVRGSNINYVYSSLWCRHEEQFEYAKEYWNYLLGPTSPFKDALPNMIRVDDDQGRPLAFGLMSQDVPNQICVPLMIQCRVPQENSVKLAAYIEFRKEGFEIDESFFLSEHYYYIDGLFYKVNSTYHHAFNPSSGLSFERLRKGEHKIVKSAYYCYNACKQVENIPTWFKGQSTYAPVNSIWATGIPSKVWTLLDEQPAYTGSFAKQFEKMHGSLLHPLGSSAGIEPSRVHSTLKANRTGW